MDNDALMFAFAEYMRRSIQICQAFIKKHKPNTDKPKETQTAMSKDGEHISHRLRQFEDYITLFNYDGIEQVLETSPNAS